MQIITKRQLRTKLMLSNYRHERMKFFLIGANPFNGEWAVWPGGPHRGRAQTMMVFCTWSGLVKMLNQIPSSENCLTSDLSKWGVIISVMWAPLCPRLPIEVTTLISTNLSH